MRDTSVTYAKALAILLMVFAHTYISRSAEAFINMFHMPLFFFVSGYCFKTKYLTDFKSFAKRRLENIYWPYIKWGIIFLLLHNTFYSLNIYSDQFGFYDDVSNLYSLDDMKSKAIDIITFMKGEEQLLGGYWFLHDLFIGSFIAFLAIKVEGAFNSRIGALIIGLILLSLSLALNKFDLDLVLIRYREIQSASFIYAGYTYHQHFEIQFKKLTLNLLRLYYVLTFVLLCIGVVLWKGSAGSVTWSHQVPFATSAVMASIMLLDMCSRVTIGYHLSKAFDYIGNNTLTILTWHFLSFKFTSLIIISIQELSVARLAEFPTIVEYSKLGWGGVYFLFAIIITCSIAYLNKYIHNKYLKL